MLKMKKHFLSHLKLKVRRVSRGLRRRMPPVLHRRAIDALLQGLCFHYDPLANRVQCSITTLAIECGLATESDAGKLSITRATRH